MGKPEGMRPLGRRGYIKEDNIKKILKEQDGRARTGFIWLWISVKGTGYPLHSPVSLLLPPTGASPCAVTFQLEPTTAA